MFHSERAEAKWQFRNAEEEDENCKEYRIEFIPAISHQEVWTTPCSRLLPNEQKQSGNATRRRMSGSEELLDVRYCQYYEIFKYEILRY